MENKKISFGFNKTSKKPDIRPQKPKNEGKVEIIDCLEASTIKIKDAVEVIEKPLVIPIIDTSLNLMQRAKNVKLKQNKQDEEAPEKPDSELTIDELAARQLIRESQNADSKTVSTTKITTVPVSENKLLLDGKEESTLDDYEDVPISDYGMAMLRGMGWQEGMTLGRNPSKVVKSDIPEPRPKGLGLGANKMINVPKPVDKNGKELLLVKGAYAKIIAGAHKGHFCQVEGFDDENCRIIVKTSPSNEVLALNEFLVVPVTKDEYSLGIKVINNAKYEKYKELSDSQLKRERSEKLQPQSSIKEENYDCDERKYDKNAEHSRHIKEDLSDSDKDVSQKNSKRKKSSRHREKTYNSDSENEKCSKRHIKVESYSESEKGDEGSSNIKYEDRTSSSKVHKKKRRHDYSDVSDEELQRKKKKKKKSKSKHRKHSSGDSEYKSKKSKKSRK